MDYKTIIDSSSINYDTYYEIIMNNILGNYVNPDVRTILAEKRRKGREKYGEYSFQAGFETSMKAPSGLHALEELHDAMNYIAHEIFRVTLLCDDYDLITGYEQILSDLFTAYLNIEANMNAFNRFLDLLPNKVDTAKAK